MIGATLQLQLQRNKFLTAIDSFISTVKRDSTEAVTSCKQTKKHKRINELIKNECFDKSLCLDFNCVDLKINASAIEIAETIESVLQDEINHYKALRVIRNYQIMQYSLIFALVLGFIAMIVTASYRNAIDLYVFCFFIWVLCCISLLVTLRIIIRDWKQNKYGQKK